MSQRGFTLIEVLVALAILALVAGAVGRQAMQMLQELDRLERQTQALWLAEDELQRLQSWPPPGRYQRSLEALGEHWQVVTEVHPTASADLRRVVIGVGPADQSEPLFRLTAHRGRY